MDRDGHAWQPFPGRPYRNANGMAKTGISTSKKNQKVSTPGWRTTRWPARLHCAFIRYGTGVGPAMPRHRPVLSLATKSLPLVDLARFCRPSAASARAWPFRGRLGTAARIGAAAQGHYYPRVAAWTKTRIACRTSCGKLDHTDMMLSKSGSFGHGPVFGPVVAENPCLSEEFEGLPGAFNP